MKTIISENQRGFLFKNGKYIRMLEAGKYHFFGSENVVNVVDVDKELRLGAVSIEVLLKDKAVSDIVAVADIPDQSICFPCCQEL